MTRKYLPPEVRPIATRDLSRPGRSFPGCKRNSALDFGLRDVVAIDVWHLGLRIDIVPKVHSLLPVDSNYLTTKLIGAACPRPLKRRVRRLADRSARYSLWSQSVGLDIASAVLCRRPPAEWDHDQSAPRCGAALLGSRRLPGHSGSVSSLPPSSSRGVTNAGTKSPSMAFTRRMCPNLFAFARRRQFQVTRKSHL